MMMMGKDKDVREKRFRYGSADQVQVQKRGEKREEKKARKKGGGKQESKKRKEKQ